MLIDYIKPFYLQKIKENVISPDITMSNRVQNLIFHCIALYTYHYECSTPAQLNTLLKRNNSFAITAKYEMNRKRADSLWSTHDLVKHREKSVTVPPLSKTFNPLLLTGNYLGN